MIGDYLDIPSITAGNVTYVNNPEYQNLRVVIAAFNTYKYCINPKYPSIIVDHIIFTFKNCIDVKCHGEVSSNEDGCMVSELDTWLNTEFRIGLAEATGLPLQPLVDRTRSFADYGINNIEHSYPVFIPSLTEVYGQLVEYFIMDFYGNGYNIDSNARRLHTMSDKGTIHLHFPIYRDSHNYMYKKYNGIYTEWMSTLTGYNMNNCYVIFKYPTLTKIQGGLSLHSIYNQIPISPCFFVTPAII